MARRRRTPLGKFLDSINPVKWLEVVEKALPTPKNLRRRARARGRAESARIRREVKADVTRRQRERERARAREARERQRREERTNAFAQLWGEFTGRRAGTRTYTHHRNVLRYGAPGWSEMDEDEQLEIWEAYLRYMVNPSAYRKNDPANPFWRI